MKMKISDRKKAYYPISSKLAEYSNELLLKHVNKGKINEGWGENSVIKVDGKKVFVKTVPLTQKEYENSFNTKNLYNLPLFYNYGVGSAGFGAFRELVAHIKTTNWVLSDEHHNFPLMYHYRIVPNSGSKIYSVPNDISKYIKNWNGSKKIEQFVLERKSPAYQIIIFLEFFPFVLSRWIKTNSRQIDRVSKRVYHSLNFLKEKKILHFDAHWENILTDGSEPYLTDFGLLLDLDYCVNQKEKDFFKSHQYYDYAEYIGCMAFLLEDKYQLCSEKIKRELNSKYNIDKDMTPMNRVIFIVNNFESILKGGYLDLEKNYASFIRRHKQTITYSNSFFRDLRQKKKVTNIYNSNIVKRNLRAEGII